MQMFFKHRFIPGYGHVFAPVVQVLEYSLQE